MPGQGIAFCSVLIPQWATSSRTSNLPCRHVKSHTVECHYNVVKFVTISHSALRWQWQSISETLDTQKTPHTSPSRARILEKIDRVITALHRIWNLTVFHNGLVDLNATNKVKCHTVSDCWEMYIAIYLVPSLTSLYHEGESQWILNRQIKSCWQCSHEHRTIPGEIDS